MAALTPLFSKFGKQFSDLSKKKFETKHQVNVKTTSNDLAVESVVTMGESGGPHAPLVSRVKATTAKPWGEVELHASTDDSTLEGKLKLTHYGFTGTIKPSSRRGPACSMSFEKQKERWSMAADLDTTQDLKLGGSLALSNDGLAVGASATLNARLGLDDYNGGIEYAANKDLLLTIVTRKKASVVSPSFVYRVPTTTTTTVGAQLDVVLDATPTTTCDLTLAAEHRPARDTLVKGRFDSRGTVAAALEHQLDNPRVKVAVAADWKLAKLHPVPARVAIGFHFGDT